MKKSVAKKYLDMALTKCHNLGKNENVSELVSDICYTYATEIEVDKALEIAKSIPEKHAEEKAWAMYAVTEEMAHKNLKKAIALLSEIALRERREQATGQIVLNIAPENPIEALKLLKLLPEKSREFKLSLIVSHLALQDLDFAISLINKITDQKNRLRAKLGVGLELISNNNPLLGKNLIKEVAEENYSEFESSFVKEIVWDLLHNGLLEQALSIMEQRKSLDFWPNYDLDADFKMFRKLLRYDSKRTYALLEKLDPQIADDAFQIAAVALVKRNRRKSLEFIDRISSSEKRQDTIEIIVENLSEKYPIDAFQWANYLGSIKTTTLGRAIKIAIEKDYDIEMRYLLWINLAVNLSHSDLKLSNEALQNGLVLLKKIKSNWEKAGCMVDIAGRIMDYRPEIANNLIKKAYLLISSYTYSSYQDKCRQNIIESFLLCWPDKFFESSVDKAKKLAEEVKDPLIQAECYHDIANKYLY